jgi:hypothetical protein
MIRRPKWPNWAGADLGSPIVDLKIKWADHHRETFHSTLEAFRDRQPPPYLVTEDRREYEGSQYRVLTAHPEPAPAELGLIFGDYLQNLRSSLDYMVGAMRADGPSRNSRFPIFLHRPPGPHGFRKRACVSLQGIPDEAAKLIHFMQPYHRPDAPVRHTFKTLAAIETLWNISKHRTLHIVTAATRPDYVGHQGPESEAQGIGFRMSAPDLSSEIWLPATKPQEQFDPHFSIRTSLAEPNGFADDWPGWVQGWELDRLVDHFHRVIRYEVATQFSQFIQPVHEARMSAHAVDPRFD